MYDAQQLADRNDEVWIEKRKVEYRITDQERIPVPAHSAGPTSQYVDEDPERSMQEDRADIP
jgi:hypothetical protein